MVCCRFYLTAAPFVTNLSGVVPITDVMFNQSEQLVQKKPRRALIQDLEVILFFLEVVIVFAWWEFITLAHMTIIIRASI